MVTLATLFKDTFQCKQISFGHFMSFEYLCAILKCASRILLGTIYRPQGQSARHLLYLHELLSASCTDFDSLIIAGDFNIHIDRISKG